MISGWIVGDKELEARFEAMPEKLNASIGRAMLALAVELGERVRTKLSGEVLNVRTGMLLGGVAHQFDQTRNSISAVVSVDVPYAAIREYGFQGTENVRAHLRTITRAWGKEIKSGPKQIQVRAFTRQENYPARSYLRSALAEMDDRINELVAGGLLPATRD